MSITSKLIYFLSQLVLLHIKNYVIYETDQNKYEIFINIFSSCTLDVYQVKKPSFLVRGNNTTKRLIHLKWQVQTIFLLICNRQKTEYYSISIIYLFIFSKNF